jgi:hypothetical protein
LPYRWELLQEAALHWVFVVVGGLIFAGLLTLYVIPAVYSYFSRPYRKREEAKTIIPVINQETIPA